MELVIFLFLSMTLPYCEHEDQDSCKWDSTIQGNGYGDSFISYKGERYYLHNGFLISVD